MFEIVGGIIVLSIMILLSGIKVVKDYDRLVVFRLGKVVGSREPGVRLVLPLIERAQTIDTRLVAMPIPLQEELTLDNVTVRVSALCLFQVVDAAKAITKVDNPAGATREIAQITLRRVIGQHDLRHLLSDRRRVDFELKSILEKQTRAWGVRIQSIEIKEIKIPREMKKALARARQFASDNGRDHGPGKIMLGQMEGVTRHLQ